MCKCTEFICAGSKHGSMKTVGINKGIKKMIEDMAEDGETVDQTLSRLMESSDKTDMVELDGQRTNIKLKDKTFDKLKEHRLFSTESNISVIFRLISEKGRMG